MKRYEHTDQLGRVKQKFPVYLWPKSVLKVAMDFFVRLRKLEFKGRLVNLVQLFLLTPGAFAS